MANETLSIQKDDARLTVIGKSKADVYINSGLGLDLGDLDIGSLDPFDLNWQIDVPDPENLPDEIRIISPPYKTEYKKGQKTDLTGIIVKAYKDNEVWENTRYPDGIIPPSELVPDPLVYNSDGGYSSDLAENVLCCDPPVHGSGSYTHWIGAWWSSEIYHYQLLTGEWNQEVQPLIIPSTGAYVEGQKAIGFLESTERRMKDGTITETYDKVKVYIAYKAPGPSPVFQFEHNGKTAYVMGAYTIANTNLVIIDPEKNQYNSFNEVWDVPINGKNPTAYQIGTWAWTVLYGEDNSLVTISWERPTDRQILTASFNVAPYIGD